jgi:arylsulfatase A-like enzyme
MSANQHNGKRSGTSNQSRKQRPRSETTPAGAARPGAGPDLVMYPADAPFAGKIGLTISESSPAWPELPRPPAGAPNVVFFVLDDVGYAQLSCYGGLVRTPSMDRVAAHGARYTNMHTTALCSPTRSCILTGRNHHSNGVANIMELATGYPGYNCIMPFENGMLSEILLAHGYNTYALGKWHLVPAEHASQAGPYDRWPVGRGFERFYGFLGGETNQWYPDLVYDNHATAQPKSPEEGYHLSADLADHAIQFIGDAKVNAPEKPFFLYFAPGTAHAPHHVPKEWADRYQGMFDRGWDACRETIFANQKRLGIVPADATLPPRDPDVPVWDALPAEEQRLYARMMEVYAGFLEHADFHFGRILDFLEETGELDNTLIMIISDNGASAEGGAIGSVNEMHFFNHVPESLEQNLKMLDELGSPKTYNHYPWGWTWAGNTPFRRWKRETYRGGVSDAFIVSWPRRITSRDGIRTQYAHAIDMVPTVLELLGIQPPAQIRGVTQAPIEGVSLAHTLDDARAPSKHETQYFEMFGHRSIYHNGWRAVCPYPAPNMTEAAQLGRKLGDEITPEVLRELDTRGWELYDLTTDFAEARNVAAAHPEKLREMVARWYVEAGRYKVLPIDSSMQERLAAPRPAIAGPREHYVYYPGGAPVPAFTAPKLYNRPYSITAEVEIPAGGAEGVLLAIGGITGGMALYVKDRRLTYVHNYVGLATSVVRATEDVPEGVAALRFEFAVTTPPDLAAGKGAGGRGTLYINGKQVGSAEVPVTTPLFFGIEGMSCGYDAGEAVTDEYEVPARFTGTIKRVVVDVSGELIGDTQTEIMHVLSKQ